MFCRAKRMRVDDDDADGGDDIDVPSWAMSRDALGLAVGDYVAAAGNGDGTMDEADKPEEEKEYFEPRPLPSRRREMKEHGKPGPQSKCFLCCYAGERDTLLPGDDVNKIVEYMRTHIGRMCASAMASQVANFYAPFRARINSQLQAGEQPLPPMSAATVLEHLRSHHHDPEVKLIIMLDEVQELRQTILKGILEKSSRTKKTRANKIQVDCLEKVIKLELVLQGKDPTKMPLYSAGARIDPTLHKQGPVATSNKKMYDYWRRKAR